jgi:GNAT superfamily N-acetyltransferase
VGRGSKSVCAGTTERKRGRFTVTTDLGTFDLEFIGDALRSAWRRGVEPARIERAFAHSLSFGLFDGDRQIGSVRAVSDRTFVSWACNLFLAPAYRGKGLGRWLMECVENHPDLVGTRLVFSSVPEGEVFHERIGFRPMERGYSMSPRRRESRDGAKGRRDRTRHGV